MVREVDQDLEGLFDSHFLDMAGDVFFFQAEDGIRDIGVTGVQTCALPISRAARAARATPFDSWIWPGPSSAPGGRSSSPVARIATRGVSAQRTVARPATTATAMAQRRVGEEWRTRWSPYRSK